MDNYYNSCVKNKRCWVKKKWNEGLEKNCVNMNIV